MFDEQQQLTDRKVDEPVGLSVPTDAFPLVPDFRRGPRRTRSAVTITRILPAPVTRSVRTVATDRSVAVEEVLVAALAQVLSRLTLDESVVLGFADDSRTDPSDDRTVGSLVDAVAVTLDLDQDQSIVDLLSQVRQQLTQALARRPTPLDDECSPAQVVFEHVKTDQAQIRARGLVVTPETPHRRIPGSDYELKAYDDGEAIELALSYDAELFAAESAQAFLDLYVATMTGVGHLAEHEPLLRWSSGARTVVSPSLAVAPEDRQGTLHGRFEQVARTHPDAVALQGSDGRLTYAELDAGANRLANHLRSRGVDEGDRVVVLLEPGPDLILTILAVLKCAAAYVPLDPEQPERRVHELIDRVGPRLVVTRTELRRPSPPYGGPPLVLLDDESEHVDSAPDGRPAVDVGPTHAAYVVFTSGSTGRPKGVIVRHGAIAGHVERLGLECAIDEHDRALQLTPPQYHTFVREVFGALSYGAALVLPGKVGSGDPRLLLRLLREQQVTVLLSVVPPLLRLLLIEGEATRPTDVPLRLIISCAQGLRSSEAKRAVDLFGCRIVNHFGPTETLMAATSHTFDPDLDLAVEWVPAGRAFTASPIAVTDRRDRLVPVGGVGELVVGAPGIASGYLDEDDDAEARFHHSEVLGRPAYRTGDRCRVRPDGTIDFRGRMDDQLKVRGHRIEPTEVEGALLGSSAIDDAVVGAGVDATGENELVAYIVVGTGTPTTELRSYLFDRLPYHLVPSRFVVLDAIPRKPNGKVDRERLPSADQHLPEASADHVAPEGPVETAIASIWSEVLGGRTVGVRDKFFEIGGHSLLAVQAIARTESALGRRLSVAEFFTHDSVSAQAGLFDLRPAGRPPRLARVGVTPAERLPLSLSQTRMWLLDQLTGGGADDFYNIRAVFRVTGSVDRAALRAAGEDLIGRHSSLRTGIVEDTLPPQQFIRPDWSFDLEEAQSDEEQFGPRSRALNLAGEMASRRFRLDEELPFRLGLVRGKGQEHLLVVVANHIVCDPWSMSTLTRELGALYTARLLNVPSELPDEVLQYTDFVRWEQACRSSEVTDREFDYWSSTLRGLGSFLFPMRSDPQDRELASFEGASQHYWLSRTLLDRVRALASGQQTTLFITLLAGFYALIHAYTRHTDLMPCTIMSRRTLPELDDAVGMFLHEAALRTDCSGDPTFVELLRRSGETAIGAYEHQSVPPDRLFAIPEVFQAFMDRDRYHRVIFQLQNFPFPVFQAPDLVAEEVLTPVGVGKPEDVIGPLDLRWRLIERDAGIFGSVYFNPRIFRPSDVGALTDAYGKVLADVCDDPGVRLSRLVERLQL